MEEAMKQVKVLGKRLDELELRYPKKSSVAGLVERMNDNLIDVLLKLLEANAKQLDLQAVFDGLDQNQQEEVRTLYQRTDPDARRIWVHLGDLNKQIKALINE